MKKRRKDFSRFRKNSKSVLFVTSQLRQREIKMAHALKSQGWLVGLVYYDSTPFCPDDLFDFAWEVRTSKEAHVYAMRLRPQIIHVFSGAIDEYTTLFCHDKVAPVVVDLNDIFTPSLMDYCPERYQPTKEVLALADGLCSRDLQAKYAEKIDHCQLPANILLYPEYCWNYNSNLKQDTLNNDDVHIVSVGTISLETYGMYDCCYLELVKMIIAQGIHFHIYPPWCYRKDNVQKSTAIFEVDYAQFLELEKKNPCLHIHDSLPVEQLLEELKQYDFGFISGGCEAFGQRYTHFKRAYVEACYSGRITDYLDAGLPILINEEVVFDYWLLKRYGVAVDLKSVLEPGFKNKLLELKRNEVLKKRVDVAREKFSIAGNAKRLVQFYLGIVQSTEQFPNKYYAHILKEVRAFPPKAMRKIARHARQSIFYRGARKIGRYILASL